LKKVLCIIFFCVFIFTACSQNNFENTTSADIIKNYFEEPDSRIFNISSTKINGEPCCKITVTGKLGNGKTYPLDTFAVNLSTGQKYFYNQDKKQYEGFFTTPAFACKTSPDGKLRIESAGMTEDGDSSSGLYALKEMRIIDLSSGNTLWSAESYLNNKFLWSDDSRYAAAEYSGRTWVETDVVDTVDYNQTQAPGINDIRNVYPNTTEPNVNSVSSFALIKWISDTALSIDFKWQTVSDTFVTGEYEYDMNTNTMTVTKIDEVPSG